MSDPTKAVFLSYASQDAEAAKRICEALRAAGVEVWFDQSELVGGDAWDQKIRKQIKECALLIPIISENTQARREGYFRLEWRIAAQRTHMMSESVAFLLPVVIDATRDAEADVPGEFKAVQWTRLRPAGYGGQARDEATAKFCERVQRLLLIGVAPVSDRRSGAGSVGDMGAGQRPALPRRRSPMVMIGSSLAVLVAIGGAVWMSRKAEAPTSAPASSVKPVALEQGAMDDARLRALQTASREEVALAEESTRRATVKNPESAQAWSAAAFVQAVYILRGWDTAEKRRQDTQTFARWALSINPQDNRAFRALAIVLINQGAYQEAETMARRALAARPDDDAANGELASALSGQGKPEEAIALLEESARRFPKKTGPHYALGLLHVNKTEPDFEAALRHFQITLALRQEPPANIMLHIAALLAGGRGDFAAARATLDQISALDRIEDRAVGTAMMLSLLERQPARVLTAGGLTARDYFEDLYVHGPKAWRLALAYRLDRKDTLARQEWQRAEAVLRQRLTVNPANAVDNAALAVTLAWLDRGDEAATLIAPVEAAVRESPPRVIGFNPDHLRLLYLAYFYAGRADAARAVPYVRRLLNRRELLTDRTLPLDPWWDKIRDQPEFQALLSEAKARVAGSAASAVSVVVEKSVAVLAFTNLSDDKANEYFSDGISEELLNVLAKVPGLKVTARTSSFHFKGRDTPIPEIARQLGVAYVVEGSVRKQGDKVRITAQLIKAADGFHVWSDTFTRDLKDIFAVQDEIAGLIAQNLQLKLGTTSTAATATVNPEAYELYLQARQAWNLRNVDGFDRAEKLLAQSIARAPDFAPAHAALVDVWTIRGQDDRSISRWGRRNSPAVARIIEKSRLAVALGPTNAEAHASLGGLLGTLWQWPAGERELREAIRLNPNYASAHQWLGRNLMTQGRLDEALAELKQAAELDPLSPRILDNYSLALLNAQRPAEALEFADRALRLQPNAEQALAMKAVALATQGEADAVAAASRSLPAHALHAEIALVTAGRLNEAAALLASIPEDNVEPRIAGLIGLGRTDEALAALKPELLASGTIDLLLFQPVFDPLRSGPRFREVLRTVGLADANDRAQAWRQAHPPEKPEAKQ